MGHVTTSTAAQGFAGDLATTARVADDLAGALGRSATVVQTHRAAVATSFRSPQSAQLDEGYGEALDGHRTAGRLLGALGQLLAQASRAASAHAQDLARLEGLVAGARAEADRCAAHQRSLAFTVPSMSVAAIGPGARLDAQAAEAQARAALAAAQAQAGAALAAAEAQVRRCQRDLEDADARWQVAVRASAGYVDDITGRLRGLAPVAPRRNRNAAEEAKASARFARQQTAAALRQRWLGAAFAKAGIDPARWDTTLGADALRPIIERAYDYYGRQFLDHPEQQWMGLANLVAPGLAAAFFDIHALRDAARRLSSVIDRVPARIRQSLPPPFNAAGALRALAGASDRDLRFFETTFLTMMKNVFMDQALMTEAYLGGGIDAIHQLRRAGIINPKTEEAWVDIDRGKAEGDADLLFEGATGLANREQRQVLRDDFKRMHDHQPTGAAFTYLMTVIAVPSFPGARSFADVMPFSVHQRTPGPDRLPDPRDIDLDPRDWLSGLLGQRHRSFDNPLQGEAVLRTPLPDGNLATTKDRWDYIVDDTLPAYRRLLEGDPQQLRDLVASPVADRIEDQRLRHHIDELVDQLADWSVGFEQ